MGARLRRLPACVVFAVGVAGCGTGADSVPQGELDAATDDASAVDSSAVDSSAVDSSAVDSSVLDSSVLDSTSDASGDAGTDATALDATTDTATGDTATGDAGVDSGKADAAVDSGKADAVVDSGSGADAASDGGADAGGSLAELGPPRTSANVFYSGHSLVNLHMPFMVGRVSASLGRTHRYQSQIGNGSAMKARYDDPTRVQNRDGVEPLGFSILSEIPDATTIGAGQKYDTLVVTEAVPVFSHVLYSDSSGYAGRFHDLIVANGAHARALLYEGWPSVEASDYGAWITRVRQTKVAWECVLSKVNRDPARATNPMLLVPAGQALATLVAEVRDGKVAGLASPSAIFSDDIHLTNLGNYFVALVHHAAIYRSSPVGASSAFTDADGASYSGMPSATVAARLQQIAWDAVRAYYAAPTPWKHTMAHCRTQLGALTTNTWERTTLIPSLFPD